MSKDTLLDIVQSILVQIEGDEVNSISDTEESEAVAEHVKTTYRNIVSRTNWAHTRRALVLQAVSDSNLPTHMTIVDELKELISVYFDKAKLGETRSRYKEVTYQDPDTFLRRANNLNSDKDNVSVVQDTSGIELLIQTDKHPDYFTSFDDVTLVFDSYDSEILDTLPINRFQATGFIVPNFSVTDSFVPDLPSDAFSLLREQATARCQQKMRQMQDVSSEIEAAKQSAWLSRKHWTVEGGIEYKNYGR